MSTTDLLFELGAEELPASEIGSMVTALYEGILNGLKDEGLPFAEARYFSTPRRLAVLVREVAVKGPDIQRSVVGPPLSFIDAASMSLVYDTAWFAMFERGRLAPGETALILGASGGVGYAAAQLAKAKGAKVLADDRWIEAATCETMWAYSLPPMPRAPSKSSCSSACCSSARFARTCHLLRIYS